MCTCRRPLSENFYRSLDTSRSHYSPLTPQLNSYMIQAQLTAQNFSPTALSDAAHSISCWLASIAFFSPFSGAAFGGPHSPSLGT